MRAPGSNHPRHSPSPERRGRVPTRGVALLEALLALVALAIGLLGLVASQARLMADSRSHAHRAVAIGLIDDLANRIVLNRDAALGSAYKIGWGMNAAPFNCQAANCTPQQKAKSDLNEWLAQVETLLPGGLAMVDVSASDPRQIIIAVSWSANESGLTAAERNERTDALNASFGASTGGQTCPSGQLCQLLYVQP